MAATNINRVVMTGNLTADPELRSLPSGIRCAAAHRLQHAAQERSTGEWEDKPNYFDVTVWGAQGENAARYLAKGRPVAIDGRLEWREWETQDGHETPGNRYHCRLGAVPRLSRRTATGGGLRAQRSPQGSDVPVDEGDFQPAPVSGGSGDDDIPF